MTRFTRTKRDERKDARKDERETRETSARLDQPQERRASLVPRFSFDSDNFGVFAERFARYMGTAQFLIWMTVVVILWVAWNLIGIFGLKFDPYPFILLNLFFSTQASYAAPLILLAQNRQDDRDRVAIEQDRSRDERNLADTEFLTREVASLRLAMRETATRDFVRSELRSLLEEMEERGMLAAADEEDNPEAERRARERAEKKHREKQAQRRKDARPDSRDA